MKGRQDYTAHYRARKLKLSPNVTPHFEMSPYLKVYRLEAEIGEGFKRFDFNVAAVALSCFYLYL